MGQGFLELQQDGGEEPVLWQQQRGISPAPNSMLELPEDRETVIATARTVTNQWPSSCTSPWFGVSALASDVSEMVATGTHLYQCKT